MGELGVDVEVTGLDQLHELVQRGTRAIIAAVGYVADDLAERHLPDEAPTGRTGALSAPWQVTERDPLTRVLHPQPDAFYAHIVARGRGMVRVRYARALTIDGVFRASAGPMSPNPFDERAVARAEAALDDPLHRAFAGEGL